MKKSRKASMGVVIASIAVLMIMASPGVLAVTPNNAILESYTGHSLSESSWAIMYDVVGNHLLQDFTPGPYAGNLSAGLNDNITGADANFYITYMNMGQVQTLYMADANLTADKNNDTMYGCSPYQLLIQHFKTQGNMEIFVVNAFMGLLAYRNNDSTQLTPNANSQLYMGWTQYSELFKHLVNRGLAQSNVPQYDLYNLTETAVGTPIPLSHTVNGTENVYTYGMSYSNVFVVWQELNVTTSNLNDTRTLNAVNVVNHVTAVSLLDSLNFTYIVKGYNSTNGLTNVTTTTKYDIGQLHNLWIFGDTPNVASYFGGYNFIYHPNILSPHIPIALYNTSASIAARLQGNTSTPGYSVAVANYANIIPIATEPPAQSFRDQNGNTINPLQNRNMTRADFMLTVRNKAVKAFEINTAQTNTYILNGNTSDPKTAISCVVPNTRLTSPIASSMYWMARGFIVNTFRALFPKYTDLQAGQQASRLLIGKESLFYLTCFPEWNGESIVNDPTFTVFAGSGTSLGLSIPGASTIAIAFVSFAAVIGIILVKKKHIKKQR